MEDMRRQEVRELARLTARFSAAQQAFFQAEYGRHRRNPTTALLLCVLLGGFGAHYFYFGRHRAGITRLVLCWTLVPAVLALFEARTISARAIRYNASLANELLLALRETVDEQPSTVEALEGVSAPVALHAIQRPAIASSAAEATADDPAESALIAAAWAGREMVADHLLTSTETTEPAAPYFSEPAFVGETAPAGDGTTEDVSAQHLTRLAGENTAEDMGALDSVEAAPASEYDAWFSSSVMHAPADPAPVTDQGSYGDQLATPVYHVDGASMDDVPQEPQWASPSDWYLPLYSSFPGDPAAAWANQRPPEPDTSGEEAAADSPQVTEDEHGPVFMYQVAPTVRREPVRYGPPVIAPPEDVYSSSRQRQAEIPLYHEWASAPAELSPLPRALGEDLGLAVLGSALAAGLADLLHEGPVPWRTQPLAETPAEAAPASASVAPEWAHVRHDDEAVPFAAETPGPVSDLSLSAATAWLRAPAALLYVPPAADAPAAWQIPQPTGDLERSAATSGDVSVGAEPSRSAAPSGQTWPLALPAGQQVSAPAASAGYASTPSQGLRRRTMQRVIVRKMAVLDGEVVAESTIERQVPLVADEQEMTSRVHAATLSAAYEALQHLLESAPQEALPAIRAHLRALDASAEPYAR
jgi:TM2 domain-containing membrane protein YozV